MPPLLCPRPDLALCLTTLPHHAAAAMKAEPFNWQPADAASKEPPTLLITCEDLGVADVDATLGKRTTDGYRMGVSQHLLQAQPLPACCACCRCSPLTCRWLCRSNLSAVTCLMRKLLLVLRAHCICCIAQCSS